MAAQGDEGRGGDWGRGDRPPREAQGYQRIMTSDLEGQAAPEKAAPAEGVGRIVARVHDVEVPCKGWGLSGKPSSERSEIETGGDDPKFLVGNPVGTQGFGLVLIGEGDVQRSLSLGDPRCRGGARSLSAAGRGLEHGAIIGSDEPIREALAFDSESLRGEASAFELFQHEGAHEDLATGIDATRGFGGALELNELGFELSAFGLKRFEGVGFLLIDGGEFEFDVVGSRHGYTSCGLEVIFAA